MPTETWAIGIVLGSATGVHFIGNSAEKNDTGFFFFDLHDSLISLNIATSNRDGLDLFGGQFGSDGNKLIGNVANRNESTGIGLAQGANNNVVSGNIANENRGPIGEGGGIWIEASVGNQLVANTTNANVDSGIAFYEDTPGDSAGNITQGQHGEPERKPRHRRRRRNDRRRRKPRLTKRRRTAVRERGLLGLSRACDLAGWGGPGGSSLPTGRDLALPGRRSARVRISSRLGKAAPVLAAFFVVVSTASATDPWQLTCGSMPAERAMPLPLRKAALSFFPWVRPAAQGLQAGPMYLVALSGRTAISRDGDGIDGAAYYLHRALIAVAPSYTRVVTISGRRLGPPASRGALGFSANGASSCTVEPQRIDCGSRLLRFVHALVVAPGAGWRIVRTALRIGRTGCFQVTATGAGLNTSLPSRSQARGRRAESPH